jgi:hypothetical protein
VIKFVWKKIQKIETKTEVEKLERLFLEQLTNSFTSTGSKHFCSSVFIYLFIIIPIIPVLNKNAILSIPTQVLRLRQDRVPLGGHIYYGEDLAQVLFQVYVSLYI